VGTAEDAALRFDTVADHAAAAVLADRCEGVDRALEAVEDVRRAAPVNLERLVVFIAADLTGRHALFPLRRGWLGDLLDHLADLLSAVGGDLRCPRASSDPA